MSVEIITLIVLLNLALVIIMAVIIVKFFQIAGDVRAIRKSNPAANMAYEKQGSPKAYDGISFYGADKEKAVALKDKFQEGLREADFGNKDRATKCFMAIWEEKNLLSYNSQRMVHDELYKLGVKV